MQIHSFVLMLRTGILMIMGKRLKLIMLCFTVAMGTCVLVSCGDRESADPVLMLQKEAGVNVRSVSLYGMAAGVPRSVSFTNAETLSFISTLFREAKSGFTSGTWTFRGYITLSNGKTKDLKIILNESNGIPQHLTIGVGMGIIEDEKFYTVMLVKTLPKEFAQGISWMENKKGSPASNAEVAGE